MANIWEVLKQMMKVGMLICLIFVFMSYWGMYKDYKHDTPEGSFVSFMSHTEEAEWDTLKEEAPVSFTKKVNLYNKTVRVIWFVLFFYVMFEIFSYKENPDEHWSKVIIDKQKGGKENG